MSKKALLFGGIGTLLECSELQRDAFNLAFAEAGLGWRWEREDYRFMLEVPGGTRRILRYAAAVGAAHIDEAVAANLHAAKTRHFHERLRKGGLSPRAGVSRLIDEARGSGIGLGYATATDAETAGLVLESVGIAPSWFDVTCHRDLVSEAKPSPAVYHYCLDAMGVDATSAIAIEDSESGLRAATAAGIACVVTPGENTGDQRFESAALVLDGLDDLALSGDKFPAGSSDEDRVFSLASWFASVGEHAA
jgi:HAD superfamily hydrolase (TIGR01509 family)